MAASCLCKACCTCVCVIVVAAISSVVGLVIWASHLKAPEAGVGSVEINKLRLGSPVVIGMEASLWINNPNGWPMSGTIVSAEADVSSLDKNDASGKALYIGVARLPKSVTIASHANTSFVVSLDQDTSKSDPELASRLMSDCGPLSKQQTTKVAVNITSATVSIWKHKIDLKELGISFDATIPCPGIGDEGEEITTVSQDSSSSQHPSEFVAMASVAIVV